MARTAKPKTTVKQKAAVDPVVLDEPDREDDDDESYERGENPWMRGLHMLIFAALFYVGVWVMMATAVIQFLWLVVKSEKNTDVAEFGASLAKWMGALARFLTGASEDRPFPWKRWGS
jgi:hypothetical protein